eukprot:5803747-Amphidinium_carterae.1
MYCQGESQDYDTALAAGNFRTSSSWVFYSRFVPDGFALKPGGNVWAGDFTALFLLDSTTVEACATACLADTDCGGFDWHEST